MATSAGTVSLGAAGQVLNPAPAPSPAYGYAAILHSVERQKHQARFQHVTLAATARRATSVGHTDGPRAYVIARVTTLPALRETTHPSMVLAYAGCVANSFHVHDCVPSGHSQHHV